MRIERLDLAPYGRFADRRLIFSPTAALHVVLGANEAGKTTTLTAISDLLFGFPPSTKYGFLHDQKRLRVGGALAFADGTRLDVVRRKGMKNTLSDARGEPVSDEQLQRALAGIARETFAAEFGLTAANLRLGGKSLLAAGGNLAETLAAGSASLSALNAAQKLFKEQADELFTPERRVTSKPLYAAVERHNDAARALKSAVVDAAEWKAAQTALEEAQLNGLDLQERHKALSAGVARRKRAQRARAKLSALAETAQRLDALGPLPDAPEATLTLARQALLADSERRAESERLEAEAAEAAQALADLAVNERLIEAKAAVAALVKQIGRAESFADDLPNRLAEQDAAHLRLEEIARKLGVACAQDLLARPPTDADLALARALVEGQVRGRERRTEALEKRRAAEAALARLDARRTAAVADPSQLKRRLDSFEGALEEARTLERERASVTREARALAEQAAALDPAIADLDALASLPLPAEAQLANRAQIERAAAEALRLLRDKGAEARRALAARTADLARLEAAGSGATRADWQAARVRREAALDRLAEALDGPGDIRAERFETARARALAADSLAEQALSDADRAARLQAARDDLTSQRADLTGHETALRDAEATLAREDAASRALWTSSGVKPGACANMTGWRSAVGGLLARRDALETRRAALEALGVRVAAARATLALWLAEAGAACDAPFAEMHRAARDRLDDMNAAWLAARQTEIARHEAEKTLSGFADALADLDAAEAALAREWPSAMARLGLRPEATPEEAQAATAAWAEVGVPREKLRVAADRIDKIRTGLAGFEQDAAAAVVAAAAPELASLPALDAAARLAGLLTQAEKTVAERDRLIREGVTRAARRANVAAARTALAQTLAQARAALGAADDFALEGALVRLAARAEAEASQAALRRDLLDAEGLDEAALRSEQAEFDAATLAQDIEEAERAQAQLWEAYRAANAAEADAKARRDALALGRDAAGAARERAEAAGDIAEIAERWLLRAAAAKLAARAIERHRAAAQDPLIARAGALFSLATGHSFAGLGVDFDEDDNALLVGRRADGKTVRPEGFSEGALDQLYLSLRLALLERRAGEPLPFVGDDLLASFDDMRAARALDLLAEFGAGRQTILFTHHARVAELARGLARDIEVLEI